MNTYTVHVVGDSHVNFFTGNGSIFPNPPPVHFKNPNEPFFVHWIGPALAYKLDKRVREIINLSKEYFKEGDEGLLVFGEIDCRCHILKNRIQNEDIDTAAQRCVYQYAKYAHWLRAETGFKWNFFGPNPSMPAMSVGGNWFDTVGTPKERNEATKSFNRHLKAYAVTHGFGFVSIFERLVDKDLNTNTNYYLDGVHLSQKAWPLFKAEWEKTR